MLAKEMAITFPALVLVHSLLVRGDEPIGNRLVAPVAAGLVAAAYLMLRVTMLGGFHSPPTPFAYHVGDPGLVIHLLSAPFLYLADLVMFVPADPMATLPFWKAHPVLFVGFVAFIVYVFAGTLKKTPRAAAIWGIAWLGITLLPVLMLTVGEHFLYLPSIGYCVLVASQVPNATPSAADARVAVEAKQRRGLGVVAGLVLLVCFGRSAMFAFFSRSASEVVADAAAEIDRAPTARRLLIVDLPAAAALAFPHAVRLARPARSIDVQILSLVPRVFPDADDLSVVTFVAPDRFEVRRSSGYLTSYLERALEGPPTIFRRGQRFEREGYEIVILDVDDESGRPRAFEAHLLDPSETLVLARSPSGDLQPIYPHQSR
jgi:hypothetical protein